MGDSVKKALWIGHSTVETGFGRVTDNILPYLAKEWDVSCIGLGATGDPHGKPYRIYPAGKDGDSWGLNRVEFVTRMEKPDVVVVLMEPWNIMPYVQHLRMLYGAAIRIVAYCVVDGLHMKVDHAHWLSQCDVTIFPTDFAVRQYVETMEKMGIKRTLQVFQIPHGVDPTIYRPCDKAWARKQIGIGNFLDEQDSFVFGNVNMNQPRKRIDTSVKAFSLFMEMAGHPNAILYLQMDRNTPEGWDLGDLANMYGVRGKVAVPADGLKTTQDTMRYVYNAIDVQIHTANGEGFGLTALEGLACGTPQICPDFAALGDWPRDAAFMVPALEESVQPRQQNVVRMAPNAKDVADAMFVLYKNSELRKELSRKGRKLALQECFRWSAIANGFDQAMTQAIEHTGMSGEFMIQAKAAGPSGDKLAVSQ